MSQQLLERINIGGWTFYQNADLGIAPYFTNTIRKRVKQKKTCNIAVVGEAGEGKSYQAAQVCRHLRKGWGELDDRYAKIDSDYKLPGIVFSYNQYLNVLLQVGMGYPIEFDEPSYAMGKREWYKQVNQALVKTVESARFMVKPLVIPIINMALLDKTIRSYLIQFMIVMTDRGKGIVYRIKPSQHQDKVYRRFFCRITYGMMDNDLCKKDSCIGCRKSETCQLFRARYERKKQDIQLQRYEQDLTETEKLEATRLTINQLEEIIFPHHDKYTEDGKLNVVRMQTVLSEKLGIRIGRNKSYTLADLLKYNHPETFSE